MVITRKYSIKPRPIIIIADTVFFGRAYGVTVFREPNLKVNLIWKSVYLETPEAYRSLKEELEKQGFTIKAVVLDGKRGVREAFSNIPAQMCQFHQVAIVNRYLTRRPKLEASIELRRIVLSLTKTTEMIFSKELNKWENKWKDFLKEKTINPETNRWCYTHKRLRSAIRSLNANLSYLFTYQKHKDLNIPNTTNSLDGSFTTLKNLLRLHRGMNRKNRYKMICEIFSNKKNIH